MSADNYNYTESRRLYLLKNKVSPIYAGYLLSLDLPQNVRIWYYEWDARINTPDTRVEQTNYFVLNKPERKKSSYKFWRIDTETKMMIAKVTFATAGGPTILTNVVLRDGYKEDLKDWWQHWTPFSNLLDDVMSENWPKGSLIVNS